MDFYNRYEVLYISDDEEYISDDEEYIDNKKYIYCQYFTCLKIRKKKYNILKEIIKNENRENNNRKILIEKILLFLKKNKKYKNDLKK